MTDVTEGNINSGPSRETRAIFRAGIYERVRAHLAASFAFREREETREKVKGRRRNKSVDVSNSVRQQQAATGKSHEARRVG